MSVGKPGYGSVFTFTAESFSLPLDYDMWNMTTQTFSVNVGIAIYDEDNQLWGVSQTGLATSAIGTSYGWSTQDKGPKSLTVGEGITAGNYTLRMVHQVNGSDEWTPLKNADKYYLEMRVSDNKATITNRAPQSGIAVNSVDLQGNLSVGSMQSFTYSITNSGDTYTQDIAFFVNNDILSGIGLNLDPGATDDYVFSWTPERKGTYRVGLANATTGEIFYSEQVTIGEMKTQELDATFQFDGATGSEILGYEVSGNSIKGTMSVINKGEEDFMDHITCGLYFDGGNHKLYPASSNTIFVEVKAGESVDVPFEFSNLDYSKRYMVIVEYMSAGEYAPDICSSFITLKDNSSGIEGVEVGGEAETDQPVYNLQGVRMPDGASLPKGIYIKGGKKIVVK